MNNGACKILKYKYLNETLPYWIRDEIDYTDELWLCQDLMVLIIL